MMKTIKKIGESASGIFTIKEYEIEGGSDFPELARCLQKGPFEVQEVVSYVFEGPDPLGIDARSMSVEEFMDIYSRIRDCGAYGSGLAFDMVVRTEGHPVTIELTEGSALVATNSLDGEIGLEDLLGESPGGDESRIPPQDILDILSVAEKLKCHTRHCDTSSGRRESVAEHSWRAALMAMLLAGVEEFADVDMDRVVRMCLVHDLGEAFTGDIPTFEKTEEDEAAEKAKLHAWIDAFPPALRGNFADLFAEMEEMQTREARLYKAIDKLEAVIQHNESDLSTWLPLEYSLQRVYGNEEVRFSPYLGRLKARIDAWTEEKIGRGYTQRGK